MDETSGKTGQHAPGALLSVRDLSVRFEMLRRVTHAVNRISFEVHAGETFAIVGESGSGKSVTALALLRLLASPPARIVGGSVVLNGVDLLRLSEGELQEIRGRDAAYIFQEPMTSLNPSMTIGRQVAESFERHRRVSRAEGLARALELLELVRLPDAAARLDAFPHQLSGGMRQRVMIAIALACSPQLLIADEPTTALDVTIQAQILRLLADLQAETGTGLILITHDLGVVAETADRMMVMYAGSKVEEGRVDDVLSGPRHPYTEGLIRAVPRVGSSLQSEERQPLAEIPGLVPSLDQPIRGCSFAPRCAYATQRCHADAPPVEEKSPGRFAACFESDRVGVAA